MLNRIIQWIFLLLLLAAGWWLLSKLPAPGTWFTAKKVTIDETPLILKEIKPLAQLITISSYDELIADTTMPTTPTERITSILNPFKFEKVYTEKRLVIIGKVTSHVGVDLNRLQAKDISVHKDKDSIHIYLPRAEVLDVIINPSNTEVFLEQGKWDNNAIVELKKSLQQQAIAAVEQKGLLQQSQAKAIDLLTNFFTALGYKKVVVEQRPVLQ